KRTYYFIELYDHLSTHFSIEKIEYLNKWTGVICTKRQNRESDSKEEYFARDFIESLEKAFYTVESELITRVNSVQKSVKEKNEYTKTIQTQHDQLVANYVDRLQQRDEQVKLLHEQINELKELLTT